MRDWDDVPPRRRAGDISIVPPKCEHNVNKMEKKPKNRHKKGAKCAFCSYCTKTPPKILYIFYGNFLHFLA